MYFFQYKPLKEKLSNRSLSDREALPYLVLFSALVALIGGVPIVEGFNEFDAISVCLSVIFAIGGTCYVYQQNGGKEGFNLIQKYVVLGWVVTFRCLLVFLSVMIAVVIIAVVLEIGETGETETSGFEVVLTALFELIVYQRLGRHIRDTKNMATEQVSQPPQLNSVR